MSFWLSEHLVADRKNTSHLEIHEKLKEQCHISSTDDVNLILKLITKLFKSVRINNTYCATSGKYIKIYRNMSILPSVCTTQIPIEDVQKLIPSDWFVFQKDSTNVTFGHLFDIHFNRSAPCLYLKLTSPNNVLVYVDQTQIDLEEFYIPQSIPYTNSSIPALFRCMSLFQLCQGYEIKGKEENSVFSSNKCVKVQMRKGERLSYIVKYINCLVILKLNQTGVTCSRCAEFVKRSKSVKRKQDAENEENEKIESELLSPDEIKTHLLKLAPNLHENQISLIVSQIIASNKTNKKCVRWDKEVINMSLSLYRKNPSVYRDLTLNKWLVLPSEGSLKIYKHAYNCGLSASVPVPRKRKKKCVEISENKAVCQQKTTCNEPVCPSCKCSYQVGEEWIACDNCDRWFDRQCSKIPDIQWVETQNSSWLCPNCVV